MSEGEQIYNDVMGFAKKERPAAVERLASQEVGKLWRFLAAKIREEEEGKDMKLAVLVHGNCAKRFLETVT